MKACNKDFYVGKMFIKTDGDGVPAAFDTEAVAAKLPPVKIRPFRIITRAEKGGTACEEFALTCGFSEEEAEFVSASHGEKSSVFFYRTGDVEVSAEYTFDEDSCAAALNVKARNTGKSPVYLEKLHSVVSGIDSGFGLPFEDGELEIYYLRNVWQGEAQLRKTDLGKLMAVRTARHATRSSYSFLSCGSQTTCGMIPLVMFKKGEKVWFVRTEARGIWEMCLHYADDPRDEGKSLLCVSSGTAAYPYKDFSVALGPGESYSAPEVVFGCTDGGFEGVAECLAKLKRKNLRLKYPPVVFNDYMNCMWSKSDGKTVAVLAERAKKIGAEYFCIDAGWYDCIGDWNPNDAKYGEGGLAGAVGKIKALGLVPGLWMETEIAECSSRVFREHPEWFLKRNGRTIVCSGRAFFDFSNAEVRNYLFGKIQALRRMGVGYIKTDYNTSMGAGADSKGHSPVAGLDEQVGFILSFYREVREKIGVVLENCSSGAMRSSEEFLSVFDMQSISDIENYKEIPSILNGSLLYLLPEQCGVWTYPFPHLFYDMADEDVFSSEKYRAEYAKKETTAFIMVSGLLAVPYISGRLDKADEDSLRLIADAVEIYKKNRAFVCGAYPFWPLGFKKFGCGDGFAAQGLRNGGRALIAVWRLGSDEESVRLPVKASSAREIYPLLGNARVETDGYGITVAMGGKYSAALFEAELK